MRDKKIVILTEGGKDIGFGHITRCISLCQAFEERSVTTELIVNGDNTIEHLLRGGEYQLFNWLKEWHKLFGIIKDVSVVIIDSYLANAELYKKVSEVVEFPVYLDDNKKIDYPKGFVINGSIYAEELNYPKTKDVIYLLGSSYIPLRKEFWSVGEKEIKDKIESIMIAFGGDDMRGMTPIVLSFLNEYYPACKKNVIVGNAFQNKNVRKIESLKNETTVILRSPEINELKEIMLESDVAVSAGGQMLYEFARVGVPTTGICVTDNQERNLRGWQRNGFIEYIGRYNGNNLRNRLKRAMENLADASVRKNKCAIGNKFVDGKGNLRAAEIILSNLFKNKLILRNASLEDASDILELSNDDIVRQNSFSPAKIEWEDHLKWLTKKLNDRNCIFSTVNLRDKFQGQVRFDIDREKKEAMVSIGLKKDMRGLGLAPFLLNKAIFRLLKVYSDIGLIKAYIKEENTSSINAFKKADFKFSEHTMIKGSKAKVYIRETNYAAV